MRAQGSLFTTADVDESKFVLVAAPIGSGPNSQLNIYEQRTSARPCFEVKEVLLPSWIPDGDVRLHRDLHRYIDGTGYSLRIGGDDLGTRYRLSVIKTANDIELMAVPTRNPSQPALLVAKAGGLATASSSLRSTRLEPQGRQYGTRTLGHLYVYRDAIQPAAGVDEQPAEADDADATQDDEAESDTLRPLAKLASLKSLLVE